MNCRCERGDEETSTCPYLEWNSNRQDRNWNINTGKVHTFSSGSKLFLLFCFNLDISLVGAACLVTTVLLQWRIFWRINRTKSKPYTGIYRKYLMAVWWIIRSIKTPTSKCRGQQSAPPSSYMRSTSSAQHFALSASVSFVTSCTAIDKMYTEFIK